MKQTTLLTLEKSADDFVSLAIDLCLFLKDELKLLSNKFQVFSRFSSLSR